MAWKALKSIKDIDRARKVLKHVQAYMKTALKIGRNAKYKHNEVANLICEAIACRKTVSRTAHDNNIYHTTLCRKMVKTSVEKIGYSLMKASRRLARSGYSTIDYTHLKYTGKTLQNQTFGKKGFKTLVAKVGNIVVFVSLYRQIRGEKGKGR